MAVDADVLEQIRERLRASTRVGDDRIAVATRDDDVVLLGAVASPEESTVAGQLAEEYATSVVNELQIDRGLREGFDDDPMDTEPASQAGDEVLIGSTDMLAGPDAAPTEDLAEALDENEPWSPPDVPQLAPTATEQRGGWARENAPGPVGVGGGRRSRRPAGRGGPGGPGRRQRPRPGPGRPGTGGRGRPASLP